MARRKGIFGRRSDRGSESMDDSGQGEANVTDVYANEAEPVREFFDQESAELEQALEPDEGPIDHEKVDYSITEDWEMPSAVRRQPESGESSDEAESSDHQPQSDTGEWLAQPFRLRESGVLAPERSPPVPAPGGDTGEQIRIAATGAAQRAEIRAMDEIVALERDLERAKSSASVEVGELEARMQEAEARAAKAEERAAGLAAERDQFESRAREAAKKWLRERVVELKAEARNKIRAEVERVRAEAEVRPADGEAVPAEGERSAAQPDLQHLIESETQELRREHAVELAEANARVEAARRDDREHAAAEVERRQREAAEQAAADPEQRQEELKAARAEAEAEAADRIAKIEADADERLRAEVAIARRAAEERFAEKLGARERELESERGQKVKLIEDSDRRLSRIEAQAAEAVERVTAAENQLAAEAEQLRAEAEERLAEEAGGLRAAAQKEAEEKVERELGSIREELDRERTERASAVAEAEHRIQAAEELAKRVEAESTTGAHEARLAASNWLRGEAQALRREGERAARERNGHGPDDTRKRASSIEDARAEATAEAEGRIAAERRSWNEERARLSAELAAARLEVEEREIRTADASERAQAQSVELEEESRREERIADAESKLEEAASKATAAGSRFRDSRSGFASGPIIEKDATDAGEKRSDAGGPVNLGSADFEQLVEIGMSKTQARRVIRYRDERGLTTVEALEDVPGFPRSFLDGLDERLVD